MGHKRKRDEVMDQFTESPSTSPFIPMFEKFRTRLDEHHERRERIVKASRDITAASKKIIFSLQRIRKLNKSVPPHIMKANAQYWDSIKSQYKAISADLQNINAYRYSGTITHGNQEFMECLAFQHYLETQSLISYQDAASRLAKLGGEDGEILLTCEDYVLGVFDMVGELMRFAITAIATDGTLPGGETRRGQDKPKPNTSNAQDNMDPMEVDAGEPATTPQPTSLGRNVLTDLQELRSCLEAMDLPKSTEFSKSFGKKSDVMRNCVEKVENAAYGLIVRGRERPKGWVPEARAREQVESH